MKSLSAIIKRGHGALRHIVFNCHPKLGSSAGPSEPDMHIPAFEARLQRLGCPFWAKNQFDWMYPFREPLDEFIHWT
jgi:hypothetical protein